MNKKLLFCIILIALSAFYFCGVGFSFGGGPEDKDEDNDEDEDNNKDDNEDDEDSEGDQERIEVGHRL